MAPPSAVYSFTVEERLQSVRFHGLGSDIINSLLFYASFTGYEAQGQTILLLGKESFILQQSNYLVCISY